MRAPRVRRRRSLRAPGLLGYDYVARTRRLPVNLLFLMPWIVIYEFSLLATNSPVDNAAAAWLKIVFGSLGRSGLLAVTLLAVLLLCVVVLIRLHEATRDRGVYGGMLAEGTVYGLLLGTVAGALATGLPMGRVISLDGTHGLGPLAVQGPLPDRLREIGLAVGAGIFEEAIFRGVVLGGIYALLHHGLATDRVSAAVVGILVSAYLFSDYHHWGVTGEPYDPAVFSFRFYAGAALGLVFLTRGLGIAAFAHGVYDVFVLVGEAQGGTG